ncbi:hypothetical protein [Ramlibacter sp.]|uniref:hypothetical protein n=1 Tax=Ramlibacter sp. TaxID=1917967 RepID=UPI002621E953|nr:hypothetical protein [Ramlibacter sp.]
MTVKNMTFLVDRLGEDCSPLQFIRELTQNSIDAAAPSRDTLVVWDVDWAYYRMTGVRKLACIDTGGGMTGEEMVRFINELSSSIHQQSASGNFGVGAKIAAAPRNPHGMVYKSWKNGVGHMIHLWLDPERRVYGLKRWPSNRGEFWTPVNDKAKPKEIDQHGTMVTLLGRSDEDETIEPPPGTPIKSRWVLRYLNTRYYRLPDGVHLKSREGFDLPEGNRHNFLRRIEGQSSWLQRHSSQRGSVPVGGATAHWWILREESDRDSGHVAPGGHVAALYQDELYELTVGRSGLSKLQSFGIIFGTNRVVIYVEPAGSSARPVSANTARTHLLVGGEGLDWSGWATEFREQMPEPLKTLQEQISAQAGQKDHRKAILERLRQIQDLLRFRQYIPKESGKENITPEEPTPSDDGQPGLVQFAVSPHQVTKKGGRASEIYALFAEMGSVPAEPVISVTEPKTRWVSTEDKTRSEGDMEDRAGKYLRDQNLLIINSDFRVFTEMSDRWELAYAATAGAGPVVKEVVQEWFEQQLIEAVMGAHALKQTGGWSVPEAEELWDESALTAAVLPRWHVDQTIKRTLGMRLGSLR